MSRYTKGPWRVSNMNEYDVCCDYGYIAECMSTDGKANARLIAAAPELLEALKELLPMQGCVQCQELYSHCDRHGYIVDTIKKCEQAILKAEGG